MSLFSDLLFNSLLRGNLLNALLPSVCLITPLLGSYGINSNPALCNEVVCGEADALPVVSAWLQVEGRRGRRNALVQKLLFSVLSSFQQITPSCHPSLSSKSSTFI